MGAKTVAKQDMLLEEGKVLDTMETIPNSNDSIANLAEDYKYHCRYNEDDALESAIATQD